MRPKQAVKFTACQIGTLWRLCNDWRICLWLTALDFFKSRSGVLQYRNVWNMLCECSEQPRDFIIGVGQDDQWGHGLIGA